MVIYITPATGIGRAFARKKHEKHAKKAAKWPQKRVLSPVFPHFWAILYPLLREYGQFPGYTHQLIGEFRGICLEESQPLERTLTRRAAPPKRTFGGQTRLSEPTFTLIPMGLPVSSREKRKIRVLRPSAAADSR